MRACWRFNSRLREEATIAFEFGLLNVAGFNSRLREEATWRVYYRIKDLMFQLTPP